MTRLATAVAAAVLLAALAPAAAQTVVIEDQENGPKVRITGGGKKKAPPAAAPKPPEEPTFKVTGGLYASKDRARESAIQAAVEKVHDHLMQQDPPVHKTPPLDLVRRMILDGRDEVTEQQIDMQAQTGKTETWYQITVGVKVRPEHVRELRSRERSSEVLWVLAGLAGLAGVFALFFRIDAWTKGYLTSWLVLGTVGAASLVGGLWWMAK